MVDIPLWIVWNQIERAALGRRAGASDTRDGASDTRDGASDSGAGVGPTARPGQRLENGYAQGRGHGQETESLQCLDVAGRALLVRYALDGCQGDDASSFEEHLITCEPCFQDLKSLDRVAGLLRDFVQNDREFVEHLRAGLLIASRDDGPAAD